MESIDPLERPRDLRKKKCFSVWFAPWGPPGFPLGPPGPPWVPLASKKERLGSTFNERRVCPQAKKAPEGPYLGYSIALGYIKAYEALWGAILLERYTEKV